MSSVSVFNSKDKRFHKTGNTKRTIRWINGEKLTITEKGKAELDIGGEKILIDVLASEEFKENIVSVNSLLEKGYSYLCDDEGTFLFKEKIKKEIIQQMKLKDVNDKDISLATCDQENQQKLEEGKSYVIKTRTEKNNELLMDRSRVWIAQNINNEYWRYHAQQGHYKSQIEDEFRKRYNRGPTKEEKEMVKYCPVCAIGKFKTKSFKTEQHRPNAMTVGEKLHIDMLETKIETVKHYVALITDETSKMVFQETDISKSSLSIRIWKRVIQIEKMLDRKVKFIICDKGTENLDLKFLDHIQVLKADTGIKEMNGLSENSVYKWKYTFDSNTLHMPKKVVNKYFRHISEGITNIINEHETKSTGQSPIQVFYSESIQTVAIFEKPIMGLDIVFKQQKNGKTIDDVGFLVNFNTLGRTLDVYSEYQDKIVTISCNRYKQLRSMNSIFYKNNALANKVYVMKYYNHEMDEYIEGEMLKCPYNIKQALHDEDWKKSLTKEVDNFTNSGAYEILTQKKIDEYERKGKEIVILNNFMIFNTKMDGTLKVRYIHTNNDEVHKKMGMKTHMISNMGLNYFLSLYARLKNQGYKIASADVESAFLSSPMDTLKVNNNKVFLTKPNYQLFGKYMDKNDTVKYANMVEVKKSVYGLANSPKSFEVTFNKILKAIGFSEEVHESWGFFTSFYYNKELGFIITHVDDMMVLSKNPTKVLNLIEEKIKIKKNYTPEIFLGMSLKQTEEHIEVGLEHSIDKLIAILPDKIKTTAKTISEAPTVNLYNEAFKFLTSFDIKDLRNERKKDNTEKVTKLENELFTLKQTTKYASKEILKEMMEELDIVMAQRITGFMNWISMKARPDLLYAVKLLSKFVTEKSENYLVAWIQVLAYTIKTKHFRMKMKFETPKYNTITLMTDASENKTNTSLSGAGYMLFWNDNLIYANSFMQTKNAVNSKQSELIALHAGIEKLSEFHHIMKWDQKIMTEIFNEYPKSTIQVYTDNKALMLSLNNNEQDGLIKGTMYFHNMFEQIVQSKEDFEFDIKYDYINTKMNSADILTKPLSLSEIRNILDNTKLDKCMQL